MRRYRLFTLVTSAMVVHDREDFLGSRIDSEEFGINWDVVRHFGTMVCIEWEYCKLNGFDVGRRTSELVILLMGLKVFLTLIFRSMEYDRQLNFSSSTYFTMVQMGLFR